MRIVARKEFLLLPAGTVFSKYKSIYFGDLMIKGRTTGNDFYIQLISGAVDSEDTNQFVDILIAAEKTGASVSIDLDCEGRDGLFDDDQLFAVWEPADVEQLINRLQMALINAKG